jgi:hypothetical protein
MNFKIPQLIRIKMRRAYDYVDCIDYGQAEVDDVEKGINEEWELIKKRNRANEKIYSA